MAPEAKVIPLSQYLNQRCETCKAKYMTIVKSGERKHNCKKDTRWWQFVPDTTLPDGNMIVCSPFDETRYAAWCPGYGLLEFIPMDLVDPEWREAIRRDPFFDPNEIPFRGRDPFSFEPLLRPFTDGKPVVSFAVLRDGYTMKGGR